MIPSTRVTPLQYDSSVPPQAYYVNTLTRQSQWNFPDAPARNIVASHPPPSYPHVQCHVASAPPLDDVTLPRSSSPPDDLTDQCFSCCLFTDPVVADDGFTYERSSIELYWTRLTCALVLFMTLAVLFVFGSCLLTQFFTAGTHLPALKPTRV